MAISLYDIRVAIQDVPKSFPPGNEDPYVAGRGDGAATNFFLPHANIIDGTLTVYEASMNLSTDPPSLAWAAVNSSWYTQGSNPVGSTGATQAFIQFVSAHIPASGVRIGSRYQAVMFSDAQLGPYLARNKAKYSDDQSILNGCHYDLIPAMLSNIELLKLNRYADVISDPQAVVRALTELRKQLFFDLQLGQTTGKQSPAAAYGGLFPLPYTR